MNDFIKQWASDQKAATYGALPAVNWAAQGVGGVNYVSSTAGSQTYDASALVRR